MASWALVTGATAGIGESFTRLLAENNYNIVLVARDLPRMQERARDLETRFKVSTHVIQADLATDDGCAVVEQYITSNQIDVLINNAVYQDREVNAMLLDLDDDALQRSFVGNVVAPFHLAKKILPHMIAQGGGKIINVGSGAGQYDPPMAANQGGWGFAYGASKAGMGRLAGCINREWGHKGILAFSVNPGFVNTEAAQATLGLDAELSKKYGATTPEAIAASLLWLVSDASAAELTQKPNLIDLQALIKTKALTY